MSLDTVENQIPGIVARKNEWVKVTDAVMYAATDGKTGSQRTAIALKVEEEGLTVQFTCLDNPYHTKNTYTKHNTDMWNQEVFELFIAAGEDVPVRYLELEINPNNALFSAWVDNPDGFSLGLTMVPYEESGIVHSVEKSAGQWSGSFFVPFALIGKSDVYRLNFYRIVLTDEPDGINWEGTISNSAYLCWNSTISGNEPAFHRPGRFGVLRID